MVFYHYNTAFGLLQGSAVQPFSAVFCAAYSDAGEWRLECWPGCRTSFGGIAGVFPFKIRRFWTDFLTETLDHTIFACYNSSTYAGSFFVPGAASSRVLPACPA